MKTQKKKVSLLKTKTNKHRYKMICMLIAVLMCVCLCACATDIDVNDSLSADYSNDNSEKETLPLIETLEFSVNDVVLNSKPEDLYYQICDVYLSPIEGLSVGEFMKRTKESSMQLTYNICEDDIRDVFSDYSDDYLVASGEEVEIFFYCERQLVFELIAKNLTGETIALKECYAFEINEMHEYFSRNAVDVKSRSWYCGGISFGGEGYTYTKIKDALSNWGLAYEEDTNDDGTLTIYSSLINKKINIDFQNKTINEDARYYAVVDKSTSEVIKFYIRYF